jgi:hypothetical protein
MELFCAKNETPMCLESEFCKTLPDRFAFFQKQILWGSGSTQRAEAEKGVELLICHSLFLWLQNVDA